MTDLSGRWLGAYSYSSGGEPVPFDTWLTESGGQISGETSEPGLQGDDSDTAFALISGTLTGRSVSFTKVYDALGYAPVHYEGDVDEECTEIAGTWTIDGQMSGPFVMRRSIADAEQEEERVEEIA